MEQELAEPADLFEIVILPNSGAVPKRVDPKSRGLMARYFLSFVDGFMARMGGTLELYSKDNKHSSSIGQEGKKMTIRVLGVPVMEVTSKKLSTPPIEVGSPGYSHLEMYSGDQKYYVYVTPTGKIGVRKTPPPKVKN
jgi:hypothetical protein